MIQQTNTLQFKEKKETAPEMVESDHFAVLKAFASVALILLVPVSILGGGIYVVWKILKIAETAVAKK